MDWLYICIQYLTHILYFQLLYQSILSRPSTNFLLLDRILCSKANYIDIEI